MKNIYRIYPSVGIARIGNSTEYYFGPEAPGVFPKPPFRDNNGNLKRQAARFRIYEFSVDKYGKETCLGEVTEDDNTKITWSAHIVNSKAVGLTFPPGGPADSNASRRNSQYDPNKLSIDPGKATISGKNQLGEPLIGKIQFKRSSDGIIDGEADVDLGQLKTDDKGRLIVLSGNGHSASPGGKSLTGFANNDGWYDDLGDGPITASIIKNNLKPVQIDVESAWVVIASPAFAPAIENVTTWYDTAQNIDATYFNPYLITQTVSFSKDIYPILKRTVLLQWVSSAARDGHGDGKGGDFLKPDLLKKLSDNSPDSKQIRENVLSRLGKPGSSFISGDENMPDLRQGLDPQNPNQYIQTTLTSYQYQQMTKWAEGKFESDWNGEIKVTPFDQLNLQDKPMALTRASLEGAIGGPFYPGIESTYIMATQNLYQSAYRIKTSLSPGFLTQRNALPWQADYYACGALWWPAQRPVSVENAKGNIVEYSRGISDYADMVKYWTELGFILPDGDKFVEKERGDIPDS